MLKRVGRRTRAVGSFIAVIAMLSSTAVGGALVGTDIAGATNVSPPKITGMLPTSGPTTGGAKVFIFGDHLTGATAVTFGSTSAASFSVIPITTGAYIEATTKSHALGSVKVQVTTPGGTATSAGDYTFEGSPVITQLTPTTGPTTGGTRVTITGTSLIGASAVKFGTTPATSFTVTSLTKITATTKSHAAGSVTVSVTTPRGTATSSGDFTFVSPPKITGMLPTSGPTTGGAKVFIFGDHLTGATAVTFGSTSAASFSVIPITTGAYIEATTKSHALGSVKVQVTTPGGTATSAGDYTFVTGS